MLYTLFQHETQIMSSYNPVFTTKLNANNNVQVRIQDTYGQYILVNLQIKIEKLQILNTVDEINDVFTSKNDVLDLKRMINDDSQSNTMVFINVLASRLDKLKPEEANDVVSRILNLMLELRIIQFDDISITVQTLINLILPITMNHKIAIKCGAIFEKISNVLQARYEDISFIDYIRNVNQILKVLNQIIEPFETILPVQNTDSLISHEYHVEDYKNYGDLDFSIFEKLEYLEQTTSSIEKLTNGLATWASKLLQPMEVLENMETDDIQVEVVALDQEFARDHGNKIVISGTTVEVTVPEKLLSHWNVEKSISCTFFNKNPMWWFPDVNKINSDVVGISIYSRVSGVEEKVK